LSAYICPAFLTIAEKLCQAFVEYSTTDGSSKAKISLHQRKFGGNTVIATYYSEDKFTRRELGG
jgi:splicing factor U2AF subunit